MRPFVRAARFRRKHMAYDYQDTFENLSREIMGFNEECIRNDEAQVSFLDDQGLTFNAHMSQSGSFTYAVSADGYAIAFTVENSTLEKALVGDVHEFNRMREAQRSPALV